MTHMELHTRTAEYLERLHREREQAQLLREALGTWRRRTAATLLAWARRLEPELLERRPRLHRA